MAFLIVLKGVSRFLDLSELKLLPRSLFIC